VSDFLNIEIKDEQILYNFRLYDLSGQLILEKEYQGNQLINVGNLKQGIYLCKIEYDDYSYASSLIKK